MHRTGWVIITLLLLSCTLWGCGGSKDWLSSVPDTFNTVKHGKAHVKKIAATLTQSPNSTIGQKAGDLYLRTLMEVLRDEADRSQFITPNDGGYPTFMAGLANESAAPLDQTALSKAGRENGYQGILITAFQDMRVTTRKKGFAWFRRSRYYIHFSVTADLFDPYTASKVASWVTEVEEKISEDDYVAFLSDDVVSLENLDDTIVDVAEQFGELIGEALNDQPWKSAIVKVEGDRAYLPAGTGAGLRKGDRFQVFEGRRQIKGHGNSQFIAPGRLLGELEIISLTDRMAEAKFLTAKNIQVGDFVVPSK